MDFYTGDPSDSQHELPYYLKCLQNSYQRCLDNVTPYTIPRWVFTAFLFLLYCIRVFILQGFHVISYALGIFLLNRLIGFLSPKIDPESNPDGSPILPMKSSEEFRPFLRRLPELKFWNSCTTAIVVSLLCTLFAILDIPVFWPILVMYFFMLFYLTMKRQIMHMIKYHYLPFTYGKPRHRSDTNGPRRSL